MKRKNGFTLIELLAVIIILGILMLVAIPSVTSYINNSRKESYIDTAKNIIKGAINLVNSGNLDIYDPETTYYIPNSCVGLETGGDSPYGKFDKAYIVVTYDNNSYEYYWISRDVTGQGIKTITLGKDLKSNMIEAGIKENEVNTGTSIGNRSKIIEFNADCSAIKEEKAPDKYVQEDDPSQEISFSRLKKYNDNYSVFGKNISRYYFEKIITLKNISIPDNAIDSWDVSENQDGSIMAWYLDADNNSKYELYLGQNGGVRANPDCSYLFFLYTQAVYLDMSNFITDDVVNMERMFYQTGYTMQSAIPFKIVGLDKWNVSKVTTMENMFQYAGRSAKSWDIGDLSKWKTNSLVNMKEIFYYCAYNADRVDINIGTWNVSNVTNMRGTFVAFGQNAKYWSIGNLSNWDTRNVTNMESLFLYAGQQATTWNSIGTLKVYADNIQGLFSVCYPANATVNIYNNPSSFNQAFNYASSTRGSIIVNYSRNVTNIDNIIATKGASSNVTKGSQLD